MLVAATILFLASLAELLAFYYTFKGYRVKHYPHFKFMFITWFSLGLGSLLLAIAYLNLNTWVYRLAFIVSAPLGLAIMGLVDTISQERIRYENLFINTVILTGLLIFVFSPNSVVINTTVLGETTPALSGPADFFVTLLFLYTGILWLYFMAKLHYYAPPSIKRFSKINLIGAILAAPGSIVAFATGFIWIFPGTDFLLIGIGGLLCAYSFNKQPKLGYVLPFKAYRLICVDAISGTPLYKYDWDASTIIDEALLSGALQGISMILQESVQKGEIQEIRFDEAILMFMRVRRKNVYFALLVSKSSQILMEGLHMFGHAFVSHYDSVLSQDLVDIERLSDADLLIQETFPYIPQYIE